MATAPAEFSNADQALIHRFLAQGAAPLAMDSNPLARALRCELWAADTARGVVELQFTPDPLFIQGTGVLQGGAVAAMLDFAMAFAVLAKVPVGASCATVTMNTSFVRPVPQGRYTAAGEVERCGKSLAFAHARLLRADGGVVVATASSTLALM